MRIAFDAQPLLSGTKSGVGFCEDGLVTALLEKYPEHEYSLEYFSLRNHGVKEEILKKYTGRNAALAPCKWFPGSLYRMASAYLPVPYCMMFPKKKQLTHFFNYYIPPFVRGKKVVTVHDMAFREHPETVRKKTLWFLKRVMKKSIRRADHIVTVSEFSKKEIMRFYGVQKQNISVVPNGVDFERFHPEKDTRKIEKTKETYGISGDYFLYLGTLEPRKNLVRLIEAYALAGKEYAGFPNLILAGGKGWMYDEIFQKVEELDLKDKVIFTGYVADEDVAVLMSGAFAFCFPSLYEGFGMPVIEAMACGTPVLTSGSSSLKEIADGAAVLADETSVESLKEGLMRLFENEELRQSLVLKGIERAGEYSWEKAGEKLMKVYVQTAKIG